ncbi:MAG: hypothetical protein E6Q88_04945 [Lysobacteraceae bacterium]|nr:MAG: hypothetical protein E6Q88_04945 [Xanthomonadaceae bacterium]
MPTALLAVFSASAWISAQAHETIPVEWCLDQKSTPVIVSSSIWTPQTLYDLSKDIGRPPKGCLSGQTCGMVDEWHYANLAVASSCPQTVTIGSMTLQPQPFVTAPDEFNSMNHHDDYQFIDGDLHVACVVCVPTSD